MDPSLSRQQTPPHQPVLINRPRCLTRSCLWATGYALMTIAFVASCTTDRAGDKNSSPHELSRASARGSMSLTPESRCRNGERSTAKHSVDNFLTSPRALISSPTDRG